MIDMKQAARAMSQIAVLKFFPSDDVARAEIVSIACRMARTIDQIDWLAKRCVTLWNEWQGPREMRAVFCSKFRPADGIECYSALPQFADGIPSEDPVRNMQLVGMKALELEGRVETPIFPRDHLDDLHDETERLKSFLAIPKPTQEEIERLKAEQEARRRGDAAVEELRRKLEEGL